MTLNGEFFRLRPAPTWAVRDLIQRDALTILAAEPGMCKSLFALGLAYHVAYGAPYCGLDVERGPVVIFDSDNPHATLRDRAQHIKAAIESHEYTDHDLFDYQHFCGFYLDDDNGIKSMKKIVGEMQPVLILLDNLRTFHAGDENDSRVMDRLSSRLHELHGVCGSALVVIHHLGKSEGNLFRRLRGSSALLARCDSAIEIRVLQRSDDGQHVRQIGIVPVPRRVQTRSPFKVNILNEDGRISFGLGGDLKAHADPTVDRIAHMALHILPVDVDQRINVRAVARQLGGMGDEKEVRRALHHLEDIGAATMRRNGRSHAYGYARVSIICPWCSETL